MPHVNVAAAAAALLVCSAALAAEVQVSILPPTAGEGGEAFEPSVAIDPANPNHLLVGAMYGVPYGRPGTNIWLWRSEDGGRTWSDGRLEPPRIPGASEAPNMAADAVAGFSIDGAPVLASMSGPATFLSRLAPDSLDAQSVMVYRNRPDAAGNTVMYDKPWLAVDHHAQSPYRGSIYLTNGAITVAPGPIGTGTDWAPGQPVASQLAIAISHDNGRTFSAPVVIADRAFAGVMTIGGTGVLDVVYQRSAGKKKGMADAVFHRRSTDGGVTFSPPETVAILTGGVTLEVPSLAARPSGELLACWPQGVREDGHTNKVVCSKGAPGRKWTASKDPLAELPGNLVPAFPAIVGTARGWYLMTYLVSATRTEVALFQSKDGVAFSKLAILSANDRLGLERFCIFSSGPCRRTKENVFVIGDYVVLQAAGGRLAAAYVMPRSPSSPENAAIHVATLAEP